MRTATLRCPVTHYDDAFAQMCKTLHHHSQYAISGLQISLTKLLAISNLRYRVSLPKLVITVREKAIFFHSKERRGNCGVQHTASAAPGVL